MTEHRHFALSYSQQRFWLLERLWPGSAVCNVTMTIELLGPFDALRLEEALKHLQQRHEPLRTSYIEADGEAFQRVHAVAPLQICQMDWGSLTELQQHRRLLSFAADFGAGLFDLSVPPLFRAAVIRLGKVRHMLVVVFHHSIFDGWSLNVFLHDLGAFYDAGAYAALPPLEIQVVDHASWQRARFSQRQLDDSQIARWHRQLAGAAPLTELVTDRPRPAMPDFRGGCEQVTISARLTARLRQLSQRQATTLFSTLLGAFAAAIARRSALDDIVIGVPVAGRSRAELAPLIGCFVNTLPIRLRMPATLTLAELIRNTQAALADALQSQDVPTERIASAAGWERSHRHTPLFQVVFGMNNTAVPARAFTTLTTNVQHCHNGFTQFDLVMNLDDTGEAITGEFEYASSLFDRSTARRILAGYISLLRAIADADDWVAVSDLPCWPPAALSAAIAMGSGPVVALCEAGLHDLVADAAARAPQAIAVREEVGRQIEYRALIALASRLASALQHEGVKPGDVVAVYLPRSIEMVAACLAVLQAGCAYLPLDPADPPQRTRHILTDSAASLAVTDRGLAPYIMDAGLRPILVTAQYDVRATAPAMAVSDPDALAYVLYTSGSTGVPRGVEVTHRAVVNHLQDARARLGIGPGDVLLSAATPTFDISVMEIFLPLCSGAQVFIPDRETLLNGERLQIVTESHNVTFMQSVPTQWRLYLDTGWQRSPRVTAICGGEEISKALAASLLERLRAVWNMYGPTEATIWCSGSQLVAGQPFITVGQPIANMQVSIHDDTGRQLPVGFAGEIHISGVGIARGYRGSPTATAQRFSEDPGDPTRRTYRSGDRGLIQGDGHIRFLGRIDAQIKIHGCRVEPEEVAAVVRSYPDVRQAAVIAAPGPHGDSSLIAYIVPMPDRPDCCVGLRAFLEQALPSYMVPAAIVLLDDLPRSASGKLDRRALPPPHIGAAQSLPPGKPPQTTIEKALAAAWARVLGTPPRSTQERFFAAGGTSLLAVRLIALIRKEFSVDLPMRTIFEAQSIAALAKRIDDRTGIATSALVPFGGAHAGVPLFLIHPTGGFAHCYTALAAELADVNTVIGIQQRGLEGDTASPATISDMATDYLAEIQGHVGDAAFVLAGWSLGGLIAYEMACQGRSKGLPVQDLILIDTPAPLHGFYEVERDDAEFWAFLSEQLSRLFGAPLMVSPQVMARHQSGARQQLLADALYGAGVMRTVNEARDFVARFATVHLVANAAGRHYRPPHLMGDALLLRCLDQSDFEHGMCAAHPVLAADDYQWGQLISGTITVATRPTTHQAILTPPQVAGTAAAIRNYLGRRGVVTPYTPALAVSRDTVDDRASSARCQAS